MTLDPPLVLYVGWEHVAVVEEKNEEQSWRSLRNGLQILFMSIPMTTEHEYVLNRGERIAHIQHIHLAHLIGGRAKNSLGNTFHRGLKQNLEVKDSTVKILSLK